MVMSSVLRIGAGHLREIGHRRRAGDFNRDPDALALGGLLGSQEVGLAFPAPAQENLGIAGDHVLRLVAVEDVDGVRDRAPDRDFPVSWPLVSQYGHRAF